MKKEIKNTDLGLIIEQCKGVVKREIPLLILSPEYTKVLLDYITHLQDKNFELIIDGNALLNANETLSRRIDRAINRIDYTNFEEVDNHEKLFIYLDNLVKILKGGKNDKKRDIP